MYSKTHRLLVLLTLISLIAAEPENCKGWGCSDFSNPEGITSLDIALNQTSDTTIFPNGQNIACVLGNSGNMISGGLCVWFWNTANASTGADAKTVYPYIRKNCGLCGSFPTNLESNDVDVGELTVGWSPGSFCDGPCNADGTGEYLPGDVVPGAGLGGSAPPSKVPRK